MTIIAKELHKKRYATDPEYAKEYDALEEEFALADAVIRARAEANLTQVELAKKMDTTQAQIARIEGGKMPSIRTLERLAAATGTQLKVSFEALPHSE